jgi:geranylgeranyl diphosphate synthase, type I
MALEKFVQQLKPEIEKDLRYSIERFMPADYPEIREMLFFHMGWGVTQNDIKGQGKRVRPLFALLCAVASGGNWNEALPAASAIELLHNFSLIHDDIEDRGRFRHGRETLWVKWGDAQAINTGDTLFTLAQLTLMRLKDNSSFSDEQVIKCMQVFNDACLNLTKGQHLDIAFEKKSHVSQEEYWKMVGGKTAALLACSCEIGAMAAGAEPETVRLFEQFGRFVGLAFQAWDDYLGIWGDAILTGKSTDSDLVARKKSLPVVYGLEQKGQFAKLWQQDSITEENVNIVADVLAADGAREFTYNMAEELTGKALQSLGRIKGEESALSALTELTAQLLGRVH